MGTPEQKDKIKLKYQDKNKEGVVRVDYQDSDPVDLNTLGVSGVITMNLKTESQIGSRKDRQASQDQISSQINQETGERDPT